MRSLLRKAGRIDLNRVLALTEEVLQGLAAVEGVGAFHGNVTPEGVLLDYDGAARLDHLGTAPSPDRPSTSLPNARWTGAWPTSVPTCIRWESPRTK